VVPALGQAPDKPLAVPFRPDPGSTIAYQVTEAETSSGGPQGPLHRRWR